MKNMWMVRAGRDAFLIEDFKKKNYVAIGWNELSDLSNTLDREKIWELVEEKCDYYTKKSQINVAAGQISRFLMDFQKGDYVLSYDPNNRVYLVGEIQSDYEYDEKIGDYHHIRKVKWLGEVSRDKLSTQTRNTLGAISTIFQIGESGTKEILGILEGKQEGSKLPENVEEENLKEDMVSRANELIKDHIMQLDWKDMQKLVAGILRAMNYKTSIAAEGSDRGRDIEASPDGLMLTEPRILVEVKHRSGQMGSKEIRNFHSVLRGQKGLYVSTGGFSKEAKYEAERATEQLTLVDADKLVELIIQNYDNFDVDTKLLIPLSKIYWPT
jgi:restriction system protein